MDNRTFMGLLAATPPAGLSISCITASCSNCESDGRLLSRRPQQAIRFPIGSRHTGGLRQVGLRRQKG